MDYEAIDREMSSWVVELNAAGSEPQYVKDGGGFTIQVSSAKRFRWLDQAQEEVVGLNAEGALWSRYWRARAVSVPEAMNRKAERLG